MMVETFFLKLLKEIAKFEGPLQPSTYVEHYRGQNTLYRVLLLVLTWTSCTCKICSLFIIA